MARKSGRGGSSAMVLVLMVIFVILLVISVVLNVLFYVQNGQARKDGETAKVELNKYISASERAAPDVAERLKTGKGKTVVGQLKDELVATKEWIIGSPDMSIETIRKEISPESLGITEGVRLVPEIRRMHAEKKSDEGL